VVLGPITNNNGLEATSFPFTTTLTANVTSATTDQVLYQWFFNGSPITIRGPQFYQQTVTVDDISEIGNYTVTAVNACGSSSASVEITYNPPVCVPVTVTLNPPGDEWPTGSPWPVTLRASASGSDPFTYEFFLDGVLQTGDVGGTLYVAFDDPSQFGTYTVNAYNDCGSDSDSQTWTDPGPVCVPVNIDVEPTPLEWFPTNETTLSPAWVIAASGTAPSSYQWYFNTDNGEVGTPVAGETDPALTRFYATPDRVGYYWVQAINDCGTDTSQRVHVNDIPTACIPVTVPQIEPSFTDVGGGSETVTWTAVPEGTGPFTYQWYLDPLFSGGPEPIVGETGPSLTVTVGPTDQDDWGDYICEITNDCGSTSTQARISGPV